MSKCEQSQRMPGVMHAQASIKRPPNKTCADVLGQSKRRVAASAGERPLNFAQAKSVQSNRVENVVMTWAEFCARLAKPVCGDETLAQYMALSSEQQLARKDCGFYVSGHFKEGVRKGGNIEARDCLALDLDHARAGCLEQLRDAFMGLGEYALACHSTRKHTTERPRLRLVMPLTRPVSGAEYQAVSRWIANNIGLQGERSIEWFDDTSYEFARVMFWPSVCSDGEYVLHINDGAWLNPDDVLSRYVDPTDASTWPVSSRVRQALRDTQQRAGDPRAKPGIVGAFCRAYTIHEAIDQFIPGVYVSGAHDDRMTYAAGTSANGALVYDNGLFLYSHHESDPAYGVNCNAFDLIRLHRFGELDAQLPKDTPMQERPSYVAMKRLASEDAAVLHELTGNQATHPASDFDEFDQEADEAPALPNKGAITLQDFHCYLPANQFIFVPTGELWPASSVDKRLSWIIKRVTPAAETPRAPDEKTKKAKKTKPNREPPSAWLSRERRVEQMTWHPGEPGVIKNRLVSGGGWVERDGTTCFNLYRPPAVVPGNADRAGRWIDHVRRVYEGEADHIIQWLAHRVQHPGEKINHALVLGGKQGIGKDTLLEPVKTSIGPWNFADESPGRLLGRFNSFVKSVILRISEARDLGDMDRFAFYDHTKVYCAAPPDVLMVDEKFIKAHPVFNVTGVIITTNHQTDGIHLPSDDRRHFVAWSQLSKDDFSADYWSQLWAWYKDGGVGHVAAYLQSLDLTGFDAKAPPRKTPAFWSIVDANRAPEDAELSDTVDALGCPAAVTIQSLVSKAPPGLGEWLRDRRSKRSVPHRLESAGYVAVRNNGATDGLWRIAGKRQTVYAKSELSVRDRLVAAAALVGAPVQIVDDFDGL